MPIMCDRNPHLLLLMPRVRGTTDLHRRYYIHINSNDEEENHNPNVSGDARRAQKEANHDAAAQEDDDEVEEVPGEDDDMDTQGYTSGYASEEEDSGWHTAVLIWRALTSRVRLSTWQDLLHTSVVQDVGDV